MHLLAYENYGVLPDTAYYAAYEAPANYVGLGYS